MSSKFLDKTGLDTLWAKIKSKFQTLGNLVTAWGSTPSDTKYPSEKLVFDEFNRHLSYFDATYVRNNASGSGWVKLADVNSIVRSSTDINGVWDVVLVTAANGVWRDSITLDVRFNSNGAPVILLFNRHYELSKRSQFEFCVKVVGLAGSGNSTVELWAKVPQGWFSIGIRESGASNLATKRYWNYYSYSSVGGSSKPTADPTNNIQVADPTFFGTDDLLKLTGGTMSGPLQGYLMSTRATMVGNEYNCLLNAKERGILTFTQSGSGQLTEDAVWRLFDGKITPQYGPSIDQNDPYVLTIDLTGYITDHCQVFSAFGWTCRYWEPIRFKVELYNVYSGANEWVTICDYSQTNYTGQHSVGNSASLFVKFGSGTVNPHTGETKGGQFTKIRITIWRGNESTNKWGISEIFFCYPENYTVYGGLHAYSSNKISTARNLAVSLSNTTTDTSFDGSANVTNIKTTGTLGVANGGTGNTTANGAANSLLSALPEWTAAPTDSVKLIRRDTGGSASFGQVTFLTVWNYIKGKISSVLGLSESNGVKTFTGDSATASAAKSGSALETAINGKATPADITSAIQDLDVASQGGDGKYIKAISEANGKISATAETMDTSPTASSTKAVTSGGVKTALDAKVDVANIDLTGQTTTILAQVQALASNNVHYARFYTTSDGGSSGISDKPTSANAGFVLEAYCNRRVSGSDWGYVLLCYVQQSKPKIAWVKTATTSISWQELNTDTDTKVKATAKTDNVNYKILATASASPTSGNATEAVYDTDITLNPSTNTIAANISGNAATATNPQATLLTSADNLNDIKGDGVGVWWYCWKSGSVPTNAHSSSTSYMEVVRMHDGNYLFQTSYEATNSNIYIRICNNGSWGAWYRCATTSEIPSATTTTPKMDGTAAVGTETKWAKGDHVHPTDTSRVPTTRKVNGHSLSADVTVTAADVSAVRYDTNAQGLTDTQKLNARTNIGISNSDTVFIYPIDTTEPNVWPKFLAAYNAGKQMFATYWEGVVQGVARKRILPLVGVTTNSTDNTPTSFTFGMPYCETEDNYIGRIVRWTLGISTGWVLSELDVTYAESAGLATKATNDGSGNEIESSYKKKTYADAFTTSQQIKVPSTTYAYWYIGNSYRRIRVGVSGSGNISIGEETGGSKSPSSSTTIIGSSGTGSATTYTFNGKADSAENADYAIGIKHVGSAYTNVGAIGSPIVCPFSSDVIPNSTTSYNVESLMSKLLGQYNQYKAEENRCYVIINARTATMRITGFYGNASYELGAGKMTTIVYWGGQYFCR